MKTTEYERGAYVYFDHDAGWCQRMKNDFTFEYKCLEGEPAKMQKAAPPAQPQPQSQPPQSATEKAASPVPSPPLGLAPPEPVK